MPGSLYFTHRIQILERGESNFPLSKDIPYGRISEDVAQFLEFIVDFTVQYLKFLLKHLIFNVQPGSMNLDL